MDNCHEKQMNGSFRDSAWGNGLEYCHEIVAI